MYKDEYESDAEGLPEAIGVRETPCQGSQKQEEGEEVCKGRVGAVPCILGFWEVSVETGI